MSAPDRSTNDSALPVHGATPAPVAADLTTDSNDPQELRRLLDRARERLHFYEAFDRTIGETLRRTGEMMEETVALREQAAQAAAEAELTREKAAEDLRKDRERNRALIAEALREAETARPVIDGMIARLQDALAELSGTDSERAEIESAPSTPEIAEIIDEPEPIVETEAAAEEPAPESAAETEQVKTLEAEPQAGAGPDLVETETAPEEDEPVQTDDEETMVEESTPKLPEATGEVPAEPIVETGPQVIDVVAHAVPSAATAIGLQQMLRELDTVTRVDAREFADGELRLHVECSGTLPDALFAEWLSRNSGSLVNHNGKAIELTFA